MKGLIFGGLSIAFARNGADVWLVVVWYCGSTLFKYNRFKLWLAMGILGISDRLSCLCLNYCHPNSSRYEAGI
ncbi:MAG: hypothetical protein ACRC8K_09510 [Waterburya sp.]